GGASAQTRAQLPALHKRKSALEKYLSTVNPASAEYKTIERSIRDIDTRLENLTATLAREEAAEAQARELVARSEAPPTAATANPDAPAPADKISIAEGQRQGLRKREIKIKVDPSISGYTVIVRDKKGRDVYSRTFRNLMRGVNDYTAIVELAEGDNTVTVSSIEGTEMSNALLLSTTPPPAAVASAAAQTTSTDTDDHGKLVGLLLGGVVVSQQAENFSQADPFMGFIAGYSHTGEGARLHWRVQGIFQVEPKKEEAPVEGEGEGDGDDDDDTVDPTDFRPFLASRKAFDVQTHAWIDWPFPPVFGELTPNRNVRVGVYGAIGGTTYLQKNELRGDESVKVEDDDAGDENGQVELDPERAKIDNDINLFYEGGLIGSFLKDGGKDSETTFMQAIIGYGNYEGLAGLDPKHNTRHRFVGKLRIFPMFLMNQADGNAKATPMFGVEINAGRGPDQIKFFTGIAYALRFFGKKSDDSSDATPNTGVSGF
ncbi:MAG TPA: hypothetical protein VF754_03130, partial [Pyrinomonadaceae bacterium]